MNAHSLTFFEDEYEPAPATRRAPVADLEQLVSKTAPPEADEPTPFHGAPSLDLIAVALGADDEALTLMRSLYVSGETDRALAFARVVSSCALEQDDDAGDDDEYHYDADELSDEDVDEDVIEVRTRA